MIYGYALSEDHIIHIRAQKRNLHQKVYLSVKQEHSYPWREPAILRAHKQIRHESIKMYYTSNDFEIDVRLDDMDKAVSWIRVVTGPCGSKPFNHFNFFIRNQRWKHFHCIRPLVHLFAEIKLELIPRPIPDCQLLENVLPRYHLASRIRPDSLFHFLEWYNTVMQKPLEDAVTLGQKALEKGWHEDLVDIEFEEWYEEVMSKR
jgi:hypothetical protein